jgi:hypothetical protein
VPFPSPDHPRWWPVGFLRRSGSRERINPIIRPRVPWAPSTRDDPRPTRTTRKSDRPRVSNRTMVGILQPPCLSVSNTEWRFHHRKVKLLGWKNQIASPDWSIGPSSEGLGENKSFLDYVGWRVRKYPVTGEVLFLNSPLMELNMTCCSLGGLGVPNVRPAMAFWCCRGARRDHDSEPGSAFDCVGFRARFTKPIMLNTMAVRRWGVIHCLNTATIQSPLVVIEGLRTFRICTFF